MHALVVYESMFGNTRAVAGAVSVALSDHASVDTVEVGSAPLVLDAGVDLLVVGGPTHAFGMTRPGTRRSAQQQGAKGDPLLGLREWLAEVKVIGAPATAAFDTRVARPRLPGSAARAATRRLRRLGLQVIAGPASFWVGGTVGPMLDGELERASRWGAEVAAAAATGSATVHKGRSS